MRIRPIKSTDFFKTTIIKLLNNVKGAKVTNFVYIRLPFSILDQCAPLIFFPTKFFFVFFLKLIIYQMLSIKRPTLLLDRNTCLSNIKKMAAKADRNNLQLIPHFKTHQSSEVGEWFKEEGILAITVTSVKMAQYFAKEGWRDITIAFPVNILELEEIEDLATKIDLKIFINSPEVADFLSKKVSSSLKFYIEINSGDGRSGLSPGNHVGIKEILNLTENSLLQFEGFYTHPGHTYEADSKKEVEEISSKVLKDLSVLKKEFEPKYPGLKLSLGDTPSCSLADNFKGIDRIHPGNFVYYDLVQHSIGSNSIEEIAICLAAPVVSVFPERREIIVHSGWIHQGKDSLTDQNGETHYGLVVKITDKRWSAPIPGGRVRKLSQEHGVIELPEKEIKEFKVGDIIGILPVHACATAFMMGELFTLEGEKIRMMS